MSVLIKRIDSSSGGGSLEGYPPGNINIIKKGGANTKVYLRWSEPDNITVGNKTLSTWSSTIIVRKEGSAPTSIKDGTVVLTNTTKNKYKDTDLVDSGLTNGKTYYYRFFTMSTDKIYNTSSSMIYAINVLAADPILKNNSWKTIAKVSESGAASSIWKVGDEIDITLKEYDSNTYSFANISAQTITLQIWDFNHFDKSDGSGKAGICFGMKGLLKDYLSMYYESYDYRGCWNSSRVRLTMIDAMPNSMPTELYSVIKSVDLYTNGYNDGANGGMLKTEDKVFIPSTKELGKDTTDNYSTKFPIFSNDNSRIKKINGYAESYWTRTYVTYSTSGDSDPSYDFGIVDTSGALNTSQDSWASNRICFCFNV